MVYGPRADIWCTVAGSAAEAQFRYNNTDSTLSIIQISEVTELNGGLITPFQSIILCLTVCSYFFMHWSRIIMSLTQ